MGFLIASKAPLVFPQETENGLNVMPLTFFAKEPNSTVKIIEAFVEKENYTENDIYNEADSSQLYYRTSTDLTWQKYTINKVITLNTTDDFVQFKNLNSTLNVDFDNCKSYKYLRFVMTGTIWADR